MPVRLPTPPASVPSSASSTSSMSTPALILCADGGGSKVNVVIRSSDGLEVRGSAGPCNVSSVGYQHAIERILRATYIALSQLPPAYLAETGLNIPDLDPLSSRPPAALAPPTPETSRSSTPAFGPPPKLLLPWLPSGLLSYAWLAMAGISSAADSTAFGRLASNALGVSQDQIKVTNDVNLLAAPALGLGVEHVIAIVCGTGAVGRTIRVQPCLSARPDKGKARALPLEDVGVAHGWGYVLGDEGSAFWIGRLAIRSLLSVADRNSSSSIYSTAVQPVLQLHTDLLSYFAVDDTMEIINIVSLTGAFVEGLSTGEASAKRNAYMAGAARVVLKHAFADGSLAVDVGVEANGNGNRVNGYGNGVEVDVASREEARRIVRAAIEPVIDLTMDCLGDGTVVSPERTALALGGGLMMSAGYRGLLLDGLAKRGVRFSKTAVVDDAAGEGARAVAGLEFGL